MKRVLLIALLAFVSIAAITAHGKTPKTGKAKRTWTFAYSGDSRNCGDFVMPAIAADVRAEGDRFYWHLGDFRLMSATDYDQDMVAMQPAGHTLNHDEYYAQAWDDFITHQLEPFAPVPVYLTRGNHDSHKPMTLEGFNSKFEKYINWPDVQATRKADGADAAPLGPWYHWVRDGVDFISLDNSTREEFSDAQLKWLRGVLDRDLKPNSGIRAIVAGMHEALPHSTGSEHAMDDWQLGLASGEQVYRWFFDAQQAGKHVYLLASHSHYYSPNIYASKYWSERKQVVPGWIMGAAGAKRYPLPDDADPASKTNFYGYLQATVHPDGTIDFTLHELSEADLIKYKWPNAPDAAIHECFVHNN